MVRAAVGLLDSGEARVAELGPDGEVVVNEWLKLAVLLLFKVSAIEVTELGPFEYADRLPLKRGFAARPASGSSPARRRAGGASSAAVP